MSDARNGSRANVLLEPPTTEGWPSLVEYAHAGLLGFFDGYAHAESYLRTDAGVLANERREEYARTGTWRGSFEELRVCLFFEARRYRHFGFDPTGDDLAAMEALARAIRAKPIELLAAPRRAYWVVPHSILAGAYPGATNDDEHERRLRAIWETGVRTFVSLLEPDETAHGVAFKPYAAVVERLAGDASSMQCLRFPIPDLGVTSEQSMRGILDAIDASLDARRPVYVHCFGGIGRTGTVVACWLIRHGHASPENAVTMLTALRRADHEAGHRRSPETSEQVRFVRGWRAGR